MNVLEQNRKIILEYGKHLQECTGNLAIKFALFPFLIIINRATCWCSFSSLNLQLQSKLGETVFYAKRLSVFQLKLISSLFSLLYLLCLVKTLKKLQLWILLVIIIPTGFWLSQCDFAFFLLAKMEHFLLYLFGKLTYNSNSI